MRRILADRVLTQAERTARWREAHPDRIQKTWRACSLRRRFSRYGLTEAGYKEILTEQGGVCAICQKPPVHSQRQGYLMIDHDHRLADKDEACRGLLCWNCNVMIGHAKEDIGVLRKAIDYLGG